MVNKSKKTGFRSQLGFILASAGGAVGLGNIWRFPYLTARNGGGLFLLIYLIVSLTFGFYFLITELALGRRTQKHSLELFKSLSPKWDFLGKLTFAVPFLVMTYYPIIGGWVLKYFFTFLSGHGSSAASDSFFNKLLQSPTQLIVYALAYLSLTAIIVSMGINKGIEKFAKIVMPVMVLIILGMAIYSISLKYTDINGKTRTAIQGIKIYLFPDFHGLTVKKFLEITLDAVCQAFYSIGVAWGMMITYGVYLPKDINMPSTVKQIDFFDMLISFLAGFIMIPTVYIFSGKALTSSGPSLLFVSMPKIFNTMGITGYIVGTVFFFIASLAALTSSISILEVVVASFMESFKTSRSKTCLINTFIIAFLMLFVCWGFNLFYFEFKFPNGQIGQLLDLIDYFCGNILMPLVALLTCIFTGWVIKPSFIIEEVDTYNHKFKTKKIYMLMIKYIAPIVIFILFLESTGLLNIFL